MTKLEELKDAWLDANDTLRDSIRVVMGGVTTATSDIEDYDAKWAAHVADIEDERATRMAYLAELKKQKELTK